MYKHTLPTSLEESRSEASSMCELASTLRPFVQLTSLRRFLTTRAGPSCPTRQPRVPTSLSPAIFPVRAPRSRPRLPLLPESCLSPWWWLGPPLQQRHLSPLFPPCPPSASLRSSARSARRWDWSEASRGDGRVCTPSSPRPGLFVGQCWAK